MVNEMKKTQVLLLSMLLFFTLVGASNAVEVAPRITDREIIESLAELKAGQKSIEQRFASLESTMLTLFSALIVLITALFGYIVWDRRTALKPLEKEMQGLKHELERDFELGSADGSILIRMRQALRELAQEDQKMAQVLRNFSLM